MDDLYSTTARGRGLIVLACLVMGVLLSPWLHGAPQGDVVRYRDFGALGDGRTDDFEALARAHDHANRHGLPVKADDGASYCIGGADRTIVIRTDTDFGKARFLIDDRKLENRRANVFEVRSNLKPIALKGVVSLKRGQRSIGMTLPRSCLVIATDAKVRRFIRRGGNANSGTPQTDVFLVDQAGSVDPRTPILWDFKQLSSITALPIDDQPLTLSGGRFTTIANQAESRYDYHARGIAIRRSKVVVEGLEHRIEGEGKSGAPYSGFIQVSNCADVVVKDSVLSGHKTYRTVGRTGATVSMGSYDLSLTRAIQVSLIRCVQANDIMDRSLWGIMGTNFCKVITLDGCRLSRFDAHQGVTHAAIRNSTLGYMGVRLIGGGVFEIEDTTVKSASFIHLRPDYGSTWQGDILIRNCRFEPPRGSPSPVVLAGSNDGQHDFGYPCQMPGRLIIDGLRIEDAGLTGKSGGVALFADFNPRLAEGSPKQAHPYRVSREVSLQGVEATSGRPLQLSDNRFMFRDVRVRGLGGQ